MRSVLLASMMAIGLATAPAIAQEAGGDAASAATASGEKANPIDTSMPGQANRPSKGPPNMGDRKSIERTGGAPPASVVQKSSSPAGRDGVATNAIGVAIERRGSHAANPTLPQATPPTPLSVSPAGSPQPSQQRPSAPAGAINRSAVTGTGMTRPGQSPATVGGLARPAGGTINGTSLRPKH